jgi:hypothetical protein
LDVVAFIAHRAHRKDQAGACSTLSHR